MRTGFESLQGGKNRGVNSMGVIILPLLALAVVLGIVGWTVWAIALAGACFMGMTLGLIHGGVSKRDLLAMGLLAGAVASIILGATVMQSAKATHDIAQGQGEGDYETEIGEGVVEAENGDPLPSEVDLKVHEVTYLVETNEKQVKVSYGEVYDADTELTTETVYSGWEASQSMLEGSTVVLNAVVDKKQEVTCTMSIDGESVLKEVGMGEAKCKITLPGKKPIDEPILEEAPATEE